MSVITPNQRALLDVISKAEGTWDAATGRPRYDITFGFQKFDPSRTHPRRVVRSGGYSSDAAGAYQFLSSTWAGVKGNAPMTPLNQDLAALELVRRRGVDPDKPLTPEALARLAPEWASLPTAKGSSYYGQPVKKADDLLGFYRGRLGTASTGGTRMAAVPTSASAAPAPVPASVPATRSDPAGLGGLGGLVTALFRSDRDKLPTGSPSGGGFQGAASAYLRSNENFARMVGAPTSFGELIGRKPDDGALYQAPRPAPRASAEAEDPIAGILEKSLAGILGGGVAAASTGGRGPAPSAFAAGGNRPGAPLRIGRVAKPGEDIFPTTGPHLDVRIQGDDGAYINPRHARELLSNLEAGGKPLYAKVNGDYKPTYGVTSPFGPRSAPVAGASSDHKGEDHGVPAGTELIWKGPGVYSRQRGYGMVTLPDGTRIKVLHTVE